MSANQVSAEQVSAEQVSAEQVSAEKQEAQAEKQEAQAEKQSIYAPSMEIIMNTTARAKFEADNLEGKDDECKEGETYHEWAARRAADYDPKIPAEDQNPNVVYAYDAHNEHKIKMMLQSIYQRTLGSK
jgi:hypothetical protein